MKIVESLSSIRPIWLSKVSHRLARGEDLRGSFEQSLERFFELLQQAVESGDPNWLKPVLDGWVEARTRSDLDAMETSLPRMLDQILLITFEVARENLEPDVIKKRLEKKGESLIVVGDDTAVRIHIHTLDPGVIVRFATKLGTMHQVSIRNMDEQHQDFLEMQKDRLPITDAAVIAVAAGDGITDVFSSLGAAAVVSGGQTMNPSTKDILQVVESSFSDKIIILPNNKNIIATAEQVQSLTQKKVAVVPSRTIPQGVVALLAFDYEADYETNTDIMERALASVKTIEITRAIRSTKVNGLKIKRKQPIGLLDGELLAADDTNAGVIDKILGELDLAKAEVLTIYYGEDASPDEAEQISNGITEQHPSLQVEVVKGGQPHYDYIISVE